MFEMSTVFILGGIAAVAVMIWLYAKVLPKKLDGTFENDLFQKLHDFFHFKKLYLEEVLKFIYTLATVAVVCVGVFMLFGYTGWGRYKDSTFLYGLIMIVGGPISMRLAYEGIMMFILLVKNTMEINNKLGAKKQEPVAAEEIAEVQE